MEIGKKFNELSLADYFFYIDNYKKYSDFNTLGLYRSILENDNLTLEQQIEVRDYAHQTFQKTFDFLQLKDPRTFMDVSALGETFTIEEERRRWKEVVKNQQKILADKKIKHRNFGTYAKHDCGYADCAWNGMMVKAGSIFSEGHMRFTTDRREKSAAKVKSARRKSDRKQESLLIKKDLGLNND